MGGREEPRCGVPGSQVEGVGGSPRKGREDTDKDPRVTRPRFIPPRPHFGRARDERQILSGGGVPSEGSVEGPSLV